MTTLEAHQHANKVVQDFRQKSQKRNGPEGLPLAVDLPGLQDDLPYRFVEKQRNKRLQLGSSPADTRVCTQWGT